MFISFAETLEFVNVLFEALSNNSYFPNQIVEATPSSTTQEKARKLSVSEDLASKTLVEVLYMGCYWVLCYWMLLGTVLLDVIGQLFLVGIMSVLTLSLLSSKSVFSQPFKKRLYE